jgi:hypothetical protein
VLDELSAISGPVYLWMDSVAFLVFVVVSVASIAIGRRRPQEQDTAAVAQEKRLAA